VPLLSPKTQIKTFKTDVATHIKSCLNGYYHGISGYAKKIGSKEHYVALVQHFLYEFWQEVKAATLAAGGKFAELSFAKDMEISIQDKIDKHMTDCSSTTD
jgi:hypothetical protein